MALYVPPQGVAAREGDCVPLPRLKPAQGMGGGSAEPDSLLTGLQCWYTMDEAAGVRVDSTGSGLDLTDVNTVGSATGKVGLAADFISANSESLTHANDVTFSCPLGEDKTFGYWVNLDNITQNQTSIRKWPEFVVYAHLAGTATIRAYWPNTGGTLLYVDNGTLSASTWHYIILECDRGANEVRLIVDNGSPATISYGAGAPQVNTLSDFQVCGSPYGDLLVDELGIWNRLLTADEKTRLAVGMGYPG